MHLVFIPVVRTTDKKGNNIVKIDCSEFWKEKDSYRMLQDEFYNYIISNNFKLERGVSERVHLSVEDYKKNTGFENTKKTLRDVKITIPKVPDITEFNKLTLNRDKKIKKKL